MSALKAGQELAHIVELAEDISRRRIADADVHFFGSLHKIIVEVRSIPWAPATAKTLLLEEAHIDSAEAWARLHSIRQRLEQINAQGAGTQPANRQQGETAC
ncbi:hypothetical protein [Marinobacter sp. CA1]|uniref:hypothetical protein n=1 Tax=Marinobacter sp. CA1 TaxID=2817656 RepID=UPI001D0925E9|nr:hypothetical protein [Marinobacter sp. CA1]UDL04011.1 hypothetical protein J2887_14985 [Marinobacter sp. CA1]